MTSRGIAVPDTLSNELATAREARIERRSCPQEAAENHAQFRLSTRWRSANSTRRPAVLTIT